MIQGINQRRVEAGRLRRERQEEQTTVCLVDEDSGRIKWIQPSGGLDCGLFLACFASADCMQELISLKAGADTYLPVVLQRSPAVGRTADQDVVHAASGLC